MSSWGTWILSPRSAAPKEQVGLFCLGVYMMPFHQGAEGCRGRQHPESELPFARPGAWAVRLPVGLPRGAVGGAPGSRGVSGEGEAHQRGKMCPRWQELLLGMLLGKKSREGRSLSLCILYQLWAGSYSCVGGGGETSSYRGWFPSPFLALLLRSVCSLWRGGVCVCVGHVRC